MANVKFLPPHPRFHSLSLPYLSLLLQLKDGERGLDSRGRDRSHLKTRGASPSPLSPPPFPPLPLSHPLTKTLPGIHSIPSLVHLHTPLSSDGSEDSGGDCNSTPSSLRCSYRGAREGGRGWKERRRGGQEERQRERGSCQCLCWYRRGGSKWARWCRW